MNWLKKLFGGGESQTSDVKTPSRSLQAIAGDLEKGNQKMQDSLLTAACNELKSPDFRKRINATLTIMKLDDARGVAPLLQALKDEHGFVRASAILALSKFKDNRVIPAMIAALADPDDTVRDTAAVALGEVGDSTAIEPLKVLRRDLPHIKEKAERAMTLISGRM